jgi:hypothetical protein
MTRETNWKLSRRKLVLLRAVLNDAHASDSPVQSLIRSYGEAQTTNEELTELFAEIDDLLPEVGCCSSDGDGPCEDCELARERDDAAQEALDSDRLTLGSSW